MPSKKPTSISSLVFWGIFSSASAACFWVRFVDKLEAGNRLNLCRSEAIVAACSTGLLIAVFLEAWRSWRVQKSQK